MKNYHNRVKVAKEDLGDDLKARWKEGHEVMNDYKGAWDYEMSQWHYKQPTKEKEGEVYMDNVEAVHKKWMGAINADMENGHHLLHDL